MTSKVEIVYPENGGGNFGRLAPPPALREIPIAKAAEAATLVGSFRAAWHHTRAKSPGHQRLFLASLKEARRVCLHLAVEMSSLIAEVEAHLEETAKIDRDIANFTAGFGRQGM